MQNTYFDGIGAFICIGKEIRCLPYAGFFLTVFFNGPRHRISISTFPSSVLDIFYKPTGGSQGSSTNEN